MKRKGFLKAMGKGIAVSSVLGLGPNSPILSMSRNGIDKKIIKGKDTEIYRPEGYHLIWEDNFTASSLDESEWFYRMDLKMNSVQKAENVAIHDGKLVLAMRKEDFLGMKYSGSGIVSKRRWQHGYYEVKAKLSNISGWHHSFWVQEGTGFLTYTSDRSMEIDVFEMESTKASNHNLWIHSDGWSSKKKTWKSVHAQELGFDASDGYHVYGYEYTSDGIKFYVDGKNVYNIDATEDDYKHYSLNLWLTVIATHSDSGGANLPAYDYYDYVRCYSKDPAAKLPPKVIPVRETGSTIYIDNFDQWGFNMGDYWEIAAGDSCYGRNYYRRKPQGSYNLQRDWALFRPYVSVSANYDVFLRWPAGEDQCSKVPLEIWYDGGKNRDTAKFINQQEHDGQWVKIGKYPFKSGWNNLIKLIASGPGYTVADAAKFVKAED